MLKEKAQLSISVIGANKAASDVEGFQNRTTRAMTASEQSVAKGLGSMVKNYVSAALAIRQSMKALSTGIEFNKFVENQTMSFTVMMKSAEKAKTMMKDLYDFAVNSPLTFKETAGASKQLMAYGFAANELIPTMKMLGTTAIATGHSLDDISYVYGTLRSQGRAYSRDLMQFGMRGIPIYEELAKVMGVNANQVQKLASQGKIGFREVEQAFKNMTTNGGRFAGTIEGFMETLTGKLSMLTDVWEKSAGILANEVFEVMKQTVEELLAVMDTPEFANNMKNLGKEIGVVAAAIGKLLVWAASNIPLITTALKVWAASKIFGLLKGLPQLFSAAGDGLFKMAQIAQGGGMLKFFTSMKTGVGDMNAGFSLLGQQIIPMILSPLGLLVAGVTALGVSLYKQNAEWERSARAAKSQADDMARMTQLVKDYSSELERAHGSLWQYLLVLTGLTEKIGNVDPQGIEAIASEYNLAENAVAQMLIYQGRLSAEAWETYRAVKAIKEAQDAGRIGAQAYADTRNFASTFSAVGIDMASYAEDLLKVSGLEDMLTDFRAGVQSAVEIAYTHVAKAGEPNLDYKKFKITQNLPTVDPKMINQMMLAGFSPEQIDAQTEATLKERAATLQQYITDLLARDAEARANNVINPVTGEVDQNTGLLAWLREQLALIEQQAGGASDALDKLKKSWTDREWQAKVTEQRFDDITLEKDKALYAAQEEYAGKLELAEEYARVVKNIELYYARETAKERYKIMTEGNSEMMETFKANAAKSMEEGRVAEGMADTATASTLEGTEMGKMFTGANPLAVAMEALGKFAASMENVNKVLNPFTTMLEAGRPFLEFMMNLATSGIADAFEEIGNALSEILLPVLGIITVWLHYFALVLKVTIVPIMQILGKAMTWLYDSVIVPVGNKFIDIMNGVIKALNKIPGVHIKYLRRLEKSIDMLNAALNAEKLDATMQYMLDKLNRLIDDELSSAQELYEVGAMSGAEYAEKVNELNTKRLSLEENLVDINVAQMNSLTDIYDWLVDNGAFKALEALLAEIAMGNAPAGGAGGGIDYALANAQTQFDNSEGAFASAFDQIKGYNLQAQIQKAMLYMLQQRMQEALDSGDLSQYLEYAKQAEAAGVDMAAMGTATAPTTNPSVMPSIVGSNTSGGQGGNVYVTVNVSGSVIEENNLVDSIAAKMYYRRDRGLLTV